MGIKRPRQTSGVLVFGSILFVACFGILAIEHVGRINEWTYRPSILINATADYLQTGWTWIGETVAKLGFIFDCLKDLWHGIFISLADLCQPVWRIIISPVYFVHGFYSVAMTFAWKYSIYFIFGLAELLFYSIFYFCFPKLWHMRRVDPDSDTLPLGVGVILFNVTCLTYYFLFPIPHH